MSHFETLHTNITDKALLIKAIQTCGHPVKENYYIRGFNDNKTEGHVVAILKGNYDIGFVYVGNKYQAVADWGMGCGGEGDSFQGIWSQIASRYAALEAEKRAMAAGLKGKDGSVKVVYR